MMRAEKRNFLLLLLDGVMFTVASTFLDINTVIPSFLDALGAPARTIGLAASIKQLGFLLPQVYLLARIPALGNQVRFIRRVMLIGRPQLLIFLAALLFYPNLPWLPVLFLISFGIFAFGEGLIQLPWLNLLGSTVNPGLRGKLWGSMQIASGLGALAGGWLIASLLNGSVVPFPQNFFLIFICGLAFLLPAIIYFRWVRNPAPQAAGLPVSLFSAIKTAWQNVGFRRMLLVQALISTDMLTLPFYIITVKHRFPFLAYHIGTFIYLGIIGSILGGFLWGYLSDRKGNRLTIICIVLAKMIMAASFLTAQFMENETALYAILQPAFILAGMAGGSWLGFVNYMMEIGDSRTRLYYITLDNICLLPVFTLPILGGILRSYYSDKLIFMAVTALMALALIPALQLKEPREKT